MKNDNQWNEETTRMIESYGQYLRDRSQSANLNDMDHWDESTTRIIEAQVKEMKEKNNEHKPYLKELMETGKIEDEEAFKALVDRSLQSSFLIEDFGTQFISKLNEIVSSMEKSGENKEVLNKEIQRFSDLFTIYEKYLYGLKKGGFEFKNTAFGQGYDFHNLKIDKELKDRIWKVGKNNDITINVPIPADIDEYGKAYERQGAFTEVINNMYDDLCGKKVNWLNGMKYNKGELTPLEKFQERQKQRQQKIENFDKKREEELERDKLKRQQLNITNSQEIQESAGRSR